MNDKFSQKAKTIALRSYWNFWNSSDSADAYKTLFKMGFSDKTMQDFAIGWNNKKVKKSASSFGISKGTVEIPEGIVLPHIIDKKVVGLRVYSIDLKLLFRLPSENFPPLFFDSNKRSTIIFSSVFHGYLFVQNHSDKLNVVIAEDMDHKDIKTMENTSDLILVEKSINLSFHNPDAQYFLFSDYEECLNLIKQKIC